MFHSYIFILAVAFGYTVTTTCALLIIPHSYILCSYKCNRTIICLAFEPVEWLFPNFTVINHTDGTSKIHVQNNTLIFNNPDISDAGNYTCRSQRDSSKNATATLKITVFMYSSSPQLYEVNTALRYHDTFINCSILPAKTHVIWKYRNTFLNTSNHEKYTKNSSGLIIHNVTDDDDEGQYTCLVLLPLILLQANIKLNINRAPKVVTQQNQIVIINVSEEVILNCTVSASPDPVYSWSFPDSCPSCPNTSNNSVLIFTAEDITDSGEYTCIAENQYGNLSVTFNVTVITIGHSVFPILASQQNQTITVSAGEEVVLNCTVSASPDPVYSWSFPDSCSSCPNTSNDSVLIFTAEDITDSGEYICIAENEYNFVSKKFSVDVVLNADPDQDIIVMQHRNNIILTCGHPIVSSNIKWDITTPLSSLYNITNDNSDYRLYGNGSIKIYYQFLLEKRFLVVKCSVTDLHMTRNKTFYLWEHGTFTKTQEFKVYIKNLTNCQELEKLQAINRIVKALVQSLQKWFNSVCNCDGHNNLHYPNLTCVNEQTGIITSTVHRDGLLSAKELINSARADIQARDPPAVHLSHGWILCLNISETSKSQTEPSSSSTSLGLSMMIAVGVASLCTILALLLCISTGIVYLKYRRLDAKNSSKKEDSSHFYDEIDDMLSNRSKAADDKESRFSKDEVVFDAATSWVPPQDEDSLYDIVDTLAQSPQLATTTSANDDEWKIKCNYEIMGLGIGKQCTKEKS